MEMIGYIAAAFIGISLGLIGGGGSILTLPVLVYLFGIPPGLATSYSLFIVGATSLIGAAGSFKRKQVDVRVALLLGVPAIVTVFITRRLLIPALPLNLFYISDVPVTRELATMLLFAALMLTASVFMIRGRQPVAEIPAGPMNGSKQAALAGYGIGIGLVTGLLGAGGGFLIIPALILLARLPMKKAVGTSLLIMTLSTGIGFMGDAALPDIHWPLLLAITAIAVAGIVVGGKLATRIGSQQLKTAFGWFVLAMGIYVIVLETVFK
ncbi:sulfite exporter TauE/SafE family protein [Chitinophaga polysaccharea]|uniref:sulfite exporter TauE/SafE family protein n=1 Tax=Chitinophaga polysaccharea TaxID=1293035 RepID=UPI001455B139|nr:sulfite exporter TauE/SafE family protein [Chitinophaga polysaccharea]NLR60429.1 sulfite exporter TauE/SafE family protein [Chitinophaga polysaccharea]